MLVNEFLEQSAILYADKVALICNNEMLTFAQINDAANAFSDALIKEGFKKQDRAIIYHDNSVESVISLFGILKAGGVFVIINPKVKMKKLEYILADCQARFLITDTAHSRQLFERISQFPNLSRIIVTDYETTELTTEPKINITLLSLKTMLEFNHLSPRVTRRCIDVDLACLIYTSGSTGTPKGVMLTHLNMVSASNSIIQYLDNSLDDVIINTLPLSFGYGLYQVLMCFRFGGTLVLEKGFIYPKQIIDIVIRNKVTGWPMVPTIVAMLLKYQTKLYTYDFPHLRYITSAGQALPSNHVARLAEIFPKVKIYSMYGLTECTRVSYLEPGELKRRPTSVGKPMPNTETYIVDSNNAEIKEAEKPGELVVRGSTVMRGYWGLPEETLKALHTGRYPGETVLYTGDLFKIDSEEYLYFLGRRGEMIKTSGFLVSSKEVENVLYEMEDIIEAAVIGIEDEILGQALKAFVHLTDTSKATEKDIIKFCHAHLEDFAVPKYISICGSLPKTESGKIKKLDLH